MQSQNPGPQPKKICLVYLPQPEEPEGTYFIANVGWLNFFINIDRYWCLITGYSKGDCITSLQVSFDSDIMKLMQQISFNTAYTHAVNYKEKCPKNTFKKHEAKK